jgi:uncharacterized RDD family membrane protein YckC
MENNGLPPLDFTASPAPPRSPIAGFWRRALAAFIDSTLLAVLGWVLGLFFSEQFMQMGGWGRLLGFGIALLYFVPLNSRIGEGQTLGKRLLRIRVTAASGPLISLPRSFARSFVLMLPYFLNGAPVPTELLLSPLGAAVGIALFGLGGSIVYLFLFNRRTRQSLHDLAVKSYVVHTGAEEDEKPQMWRGHYVVVACILLLAAAISFVGPRLGKLAGFSEILTTYEAVCREPEVASAQVMAPTTYFTSTKGNRTSSGVTVNIRLNQRMADKETLGRKFARIVLETYPKAGAKDFITISFSEGYDIGIASWFLNHGFNYSPAQWREKIDASPPVSETL